MMRRALFAAWVVALSASSAAAADKLTLDGVWGNEAGCKFEKEQSRSDETMMILRPTGIESYATGCEWVQVLQGNGAQLATGICGYEGEGGLGSETFVIAPDTGDPTLMKIYTHGGETWGEVRKCP